MYLTHIDRYVINIQAIAYITHPAKADGALDTDVFRVTLCGNSFVDLNQDQFNRLQRVIGEFIRVEEPSMWINRDRIICMELIPGDNTVLRFEGGNTWLRIPLAALRQCAAEFGVSRDVFQPFQLTLPIPEETQDE
jgi:hypothetical protein